jgi:hypothetical protein
MANVIGLGVQFTANANGMTKGLSQAEKAIGSLARQASDAARLFDSFAGSSSAASAAQQQVATDIAFLTSAFKTGQIGADEFARELGIITGEAQTQAAAFAEGARITQQVATAEERRTAQLERLGQLLAQGAISEETYSRAAAEASGANEEAARAEQERAASLARAAQITKANLSPQQVYDNEVQELTAHLQAGRISQETFNSAVAKATATFAKAESAAKGYDRVVEAAGDGGTLKFNELSGVLASIPGPIGNVAGRLSGLASAGEGLGRIFSGGLTEGLAGIGSTVAGLVNPFTIALGGVAAFAAGATAVAQGLVSLEDRVEKLGNLADQLGVSFEFIQVLEESANRSGVSVETLSGSMTRLQKTLAGADEESKAAQSALSRLGVSIDELNGLSQEDQIRLIGDRLSAIEDPAKRTAAAMALFGKSGAQLLPFFNNLGPAADDIERLGGALSEIDRGRIDDFGSGIDALGVASSRLGELLLLPFAGLGEGVARGASEFLGGVNAIIGPIGDVLEPALSALGTQFEIIGTIFGTVGRLIGTVLSPLGEIFQGLGQSFEPFRDAVADSVRAFGDAAVATADWLVSFTPLGVIADNIGAIGETIGRVVTIIGTAFSQVGEYVGGVVTSFAEFLGLQGALEAIGTAITSVFGSVSQTFATISGAIGGTVGRLLTIIENFLGIKNEAEQPVVPELDMSQANLAATQFSQQIGDAATAAAEFGEAGFQAALSYQESLEQIAQLQADNTLSSEEAKAAAAQAKQQFDQTIESLGSEAEAQKKAAEEAQKAADAKVAAAERAADAQIDADRRRADAFMQTQGIGAEDDRTKAAEALAAITRQIAEAEAEIADARARGDKESEAAAIKRLGLLDQAQAAAQETVDFGFSTADAQRALDTTLADLDNTFTFENFQVAPEAFSEAQQQLADLQQQLEAKTIDPETYRQAADAIRAGFEDALETAQKIADLNERYAEQAAQIERERLAALERVGPTTVQVADVRTQEGASQFLRLATGQQDPAIEEYRKQLTKLDEIKREIAKVGGTVEIVGA